MSYAVSVTQARMVNDALVDEVTRPRNPERDLCVGVMHQAVDDYLEREPTPFSGERRGLYLARVKKWRSCRESAKAFIFQSNPLFEGYCAFLDLDPDAVRDGVRMRERERSDAA